MMPTLLLIGGTLCDDALWAPLLALTPPLGSRVQVVDYGRHASARAAAADLLDTHAGLLVPVGFSLGGFVALEMAAQAPQRLAGLALVASNARADTPAGVQARQRTADLAAGFGPGAAIRHSLWPAYVAAGRRSDNALQDTIAAMADRQGIDALRRQMAIAATRTDSLARLSAWLGPALIVSGAEDGINPEDRQREMHDRLRQGRWVSLPNVGHFVPLEAPLALHGVLRTWLQPLIAQAARGQDPARPPGLPASARRAPTRRPPRGGIPPR